MFALMLGAAQAHFQSTTAAHAGPAFASRSTALVADKIARSHSTNRISLCNHPYLWVEFDAPTAGFETLMVGATVPVIERFQETRVAVAILSPGLTEASQADLDLLPVAIRDQVPAGYGAVAVPGVPDQSTCGFADDPMSKCGAAHFEDPTTPCIPPYTARGNEAAPFAAPFEFSPRCFYHEDWVGSDMWVVQDELVPITAPGSKHYIVFWSPGDQKLGPPTSTAKFTAVFGDEGQSEEFSGRPVDVGQAAQKSQDFYEMACHSPPPPIAMHWNFVPEAARPKDKCVPSFAPAIPNLYSCDSAGGASASPLCNSLVHNEGQCEGLYRYPSASAMSTGYDQCDALMLTFAEFGPEPADSEWLGSARCVQSCAHQLCASTSDSSGGGPGVNSVLMPSYT